MAGATSPGNHTLSPGSARISPGYAVIRFSQACPQLVHGQVVSSGHFVQTEVSDQVNAMISRFLLVDVTPS